MGEQVKSRLEDLVNPNVIKRSEILLGSVVQAFLIRARERQFDNSNIRVGMELEVNALDNNLGLYPISNHLNKILKEFPNAGPELGKHNIEMSSNPYSFDLIGLERLLNDIQAFWNVVSRYASVYGTGILEIIDPKELDKFTSTSGFTRYIALNVNLRRLMEKNGKEPFAFEIGNKVWKFNNIYPEALITSVQTHIQIPRFNEIPNYLNTSFIIYPILLHLFSNSPIINGEFTGYLNARIPWFQGIVNTGEAKASRCYFGSLYGGWYRDPYQPFYEILRFGMIIPVVPKNGEKRPEEDVVPEHYKLLALAGGTVWPWSRIRFGWGKDQHIRMEMRPVCTQPTPIENFLVSYISAILVKAYKESSRSWVKKVPFDLVRKNFYNVIRGNNVIYWLSNGEVSREKVGGVARKLLEMAENWARENNLYHPTWFEKLYYILGRGSPARVKMRMLENGYKMEDIVWSSIRYGKKNEVWKGE